MFHKLLIQVRVLPSPLLALTMTILRLVYWLGQLFLVQLEMVRFHQCSDKQCQLYGDSRLMVRYKSQYHRYLQYYYFVLIWKIEDEGSSPSYLPISATYNTIISQVRVLYYPSQMDDQHSWLMQYTFNVSIKQLFLENIYSFHINFNKQNYDNKQRKSDVYHQ